MSTNSSILNIPTSSLVFSINERMIHKAMNASSCKNLIDWTVFGEFTSIGQDDLWKGYKITKETPEPS